MVVGASRVALWFVQQIGVVGVVFALTLSYYEGVPGLRDIPFAGKIPVIRELIVGRVEIERGKAADAAREGYVQRAELKAAQAQAEAYRIQAVQNAAFAEEARSQSKQANAERDRALADQEKADAEDTDPDVSRWRQHDLDRLRGKADTATGPAR